MSVSLAFSAPQYGHVVDAGKCSAAHERHRAASSRGPSGPSAKSPGAMGRGGGMPVISQGQNAWANAVKKPSPCDRLAWEGPSMRGHISIGAIAAMVFGLIRPVSTTLRDDLCAPAGERCMLTA